jgi:hypothetical protein
MTGTSSRQFGFIIAYVLPGFIALAGLAPLFPTVALWLRPVSAGQYDFGLGPPLYAVLAALALGLVLSCFRWAIVDRLHELTGLHRPAWDDRELERVLAGFDYLVQNHFRYYECIANTMLALLAAYALNRVTGTFGFLSVWTDLGMAVVLVVLFFASRNALAFYYTRTGRLIGQAELGDVMFNGNDHGGSGGHTGQPKQPAPDKPAPASAPQPNAPKQPSDGSKKDGE